MVDISSNSQRYQRSYGPFSRWAVRLGLALHRGLASLPPSVLGWLGPVLGRLFMMVGGRRRHVAATNLRLCFPELTAAEREALLRRHFESLGMSFLEASLAWWAPEEKLRALVELRGAEHLTSAASRGKGIIMLGAHYTTLELSGPLMALVSPVPLTVIYRPHEHPVIDAITTEQRRSRIGAAIPRDDIKSMVRTLRKGGAVWFASDQNFGLRNSVFSPFFGVPAATNTAPARLAQLTGATVVPFVSERVSYSPLRYRLTVLAPLDDFPSDDPKRDMDRINLLIEEQVRKMPEQYLWVHRRFKDRPEGEPGFYEPERD